MVKKITFSKQERKLLKLLVKKELYEFEKDDESILREPPKLLAAEAKYGEFLKELLKKL